MLCLALQPGQKSGLILLTILRSLKIEGAKNNFNKKCAPNLLFFNEKKIQRDSNDF